VVAAMVARPVRADDPPTQEQTDAAKRAFDAAAVLYDAGKLLEAVEKLKESYQISHNAFLLYNIGHTYDQAGEQAKALFFYVKFTANEPPNAPMHDDVAKRIAALKTQNVEPDATADQAAPTTTPIPFQHKLIDSVPPGRPCDVTAIVPEAANLTVTLFFRSSGEETFTSKVMSRRNDEVVARIPGAKISGSTFQYYIEARDSSGALIARSAKSTSPNLVNIEAGTSPHFTHDPNDPTENVAPPPKPITTGGELQAEPPSRFSTRTWISSGIAGGFLAAALVTYIVAKHQSDRLHADTVSCGTPPCRSFDTTFDSQVESTGARYNGMYEITVIIGLGAGAVAGYFWYRDLTRPPTTTETAWAITPAIGNKFVGAAAGTRF
jgi:hypothetical protein